MQSQNFEFLKEKWPEMAGLAGFAEHYVYEDPQSALIKLRNFAERCVAIVYSEVNLPRPHMASFMEQLCNDAFEAVTPKVVIDKLHAIRILGNKVAHGDKVSEQNALWILKEAFDIARWLFVTYANGNINSINGYEQPKAPQSIKADYKTERKIMLEQYVKQEARMQALLDELDTERQKATQLEHSVEELAKIKQQAHNKGQQAANALHFNEAATRKHLIDLQLAQVGWNIANADPSNA